jgi:hypothetical protein
MIMMLMSSDPLFAIAANVRDVSDFFNSTNAGVTDEAIPKALSVMWNYALNGSLYKMSCSLGLVAAVVGVGFWSLKFYKALNESTLLPTVNEVLYPLLIVVLLANGGSNMRSATFGMKDMINTINRSVHKVVDLDVSYQAAYKVLARASIDGYLMQSLYSSCEANIDQTKLTECLTTGQALMDGRLNGRFSSLTSNVKPELSTAINNTNTYQKNQSSEKVAKGKQSTNKGSVAEAAGTATPNSSNQVFTATKIIDGKNPEDLSFQKNILALRKAFLYLLEVFMLVLALVGPIFVGLSMFPVGTKPVVSWGALFLAAGFCKICYTLVSGLSAVAMVLTGPENIDMSIFAIIVGGMAPILSVTITSILVSSFSSAITSISYPAKEYGINAGLTAGAPPGQPQSSTESSRARSGSGNNGAK